MEKFVIILAALSILFASAAIGEDAYESDWTLQLDTNNNSAGPMVLDSSGNTFVTGSINLGQGNIAGLLSGTITDAFIAKYDLAGNLLWTDQIDIAGNDSCSGVAVDNFDNSFVTGSSLVRVESNFDPNLPININDNYLKIINYYEGFLAKYDSQGNQLWIRKLDEGDSYRFNSVAVDSSGNSYIAGSICYNLSTSNSNSFNSFIAKYDSEGNLLWLRNDSTGYSVSKLALDSSGNAYICGMYTKEVLNGPSWGGSVTSGALIASDLQSPQRGIVFPLEPGDSGIPITVPGAEYPGGIPIIGPGTEYPGGISIPQITISQYDIFISKYDPEGNLIWREIFDSDKSLTPTSFAIDNSGKAFILGYAQEPMISIIGSLHSGRESFIAKCDEQGKLLWFKDIHIEGIAYPSITVDHEIGDGSIIIGEIIPGRSVTCSCVTTDKSGNAFITGYEYRSFPLSPNVSDNDPFIAKYDPQGDLLWASTIDTDRYTTSSFITLDSSESVYICGANKDSLLFTPESNQNAYVMKFSANLAPVADAGKDLVLSADAQCGAKVILDGAGSSDEDGDELAYFWFYDGELIGEGVQFEMACGLGEFVFTLIVNDGREDSEPDEVTITVVDDTSPDFKVQADIPVIWPANNKMVKITPSFEVYDNCSSELVIELVDVTCNQKSKKDIKITKDGIFLRACRDAKDKEGRIYTITYKVTDKSGNEATASTEVKVPHNRRNSIKGSRIKRPRRKLNARSKSRKPGVKN